jgi:hypothetical protein
MDMSQYLCQEEINNTLEEEEDYEVFPDLEEGWTLKCRFDASTIGSSKPFAELGKITMVERKEQYTEDILDDIPNLDEVLQILSYKELEAKFLELDEDDTTNETTDEPEEETPRRRERKRQDDDDDEDKEEKPKRTRKKTEETEEEPEKPKRSRRERKPKDEKEDRCPHGHAFGKDCDEYKECEKCNEWDDCGEEQDKK